MVNLRPVGRSLGGRLTIISLMVSAWAVSANTWAEKSIVYPIEAAETGFDPAAVNDSYSSLVLANIFDSLLIYDPLAKPATLIPNLTTALPTASPDGKVYTMTLQRGIYFIDDKVFKGKKRELTAYDVVYSLQRLVDPNEKRPWGFLISDKVVGLSEKIKAAKKNKKFNFDQPLEGLKALDRYTVQITLKQADFNLPYILAQPSTGIVAREVVETYGRDIDAHPVGTAAYRLAIWERGNRMVLKKNPHFRKIQYQAPAGKEVDPKLVKEIQAHAIPAIDTVEIRLIEQPQTSWLSFLKGNLDIIPALAGEYRKIAVPNRQLMPALKKRGVNVQYEASPDVTYTSFNMEDPVIGGYGKDKLALRRAIAMSYDNQKEINLIRNGQAIEAQGPWAPGIAGYDAKYKNVAHTYNIEKANALLDIFGYKDKNGDGYRDLPNGQPFTLTYLGTASRDFEGLFKKGLERIKIKVKIENTTFPDLLKRKDVGQFQISGAAWAADYPDAENFLQLLYGPNKGVSNDARFDLPEYNQLYRDISMMADSPARNAKIIKMMILVENYTPWMANAHRIVTGLSQGWVKGYQPHPIDKVRFMYLDVDAAAKARHKN